MRKEKNEQRMENWSRDQTGEKSESVTKALKKHESMRKGLRRVRKNGGGGGWIEKSARRAGGGETKTCGAKAGDTRRPASERARRERQEGGGQFIWSFIRGSETEERETGSRTKAIRGFSGEDMCGQKSISPPSVSTQHTQYQQHR